MMKRHNDGTYCVPRLTVFACLFLALGAIAVWPDAPYYDTCSGLPQPACRKATGCQWYEKQTPWCYDKRYEEKKPPQGLHPPSDFVKKFFIFSFGTHLAEGTNNQIYYNYNVTECATACLLSPLTPGGERAPIGARCLSFDFYPMEQPDGSHPLYESRETGICVLNTHNKDSARLRNEDQGLTDAELFYRFSHFTKRPFSNLDGYYEIRDPRGTGLAKMLDYQAGGINFGLPFVWGQARWGIAHTKVPPPIDTTYGCNGALSDSPDEEPLGTPVFEGGYTPVDNEQHCPGKVTKSAAQALCQASGGFLCPTQDALKQLNGKKLGCSYDGELMWAEEDSESSGPKFVRCCAKYGVVDTCDVYTQENINICASYTQQHHCVNQGSGIARQIKDGFGNLLIKYRNACKSETGPCKGLVEQWFPRDKCVWCLKPGSNEGSCRPGNDYGICETASAEAKALFSLLIQSQCGPNTICRLAYKFPDLGMVLNVPTQSPTSLAPTPPTITNSPTPPPVRCNLVLNKDRCNSFEAQCSWKSGKCVKV